MKRIVVIEIEVDDRDNGEEWAVGFVVGAMIAAASNPLSPLHNWQVKEVL